MKIIRESEVESSLTMGRCIEAMREAMIAVSAGRVHLPIRQFMPVTDAPGKMAIMPGVLGDAAHEPWRFGIKLVCKYQRAADSPLGSHVGMVLVFDAAEGVPLAMIEGSSLTAIRTAAASALATDLLARKSTGHLLVIGNGEQARRHLIAILSVREPETVSVWGRNRTRTEGFATRMSEELGRPVGVADSLETAVRSADLLCTTTSAPEPLLYGDWLQPGCHVNLVGSATPTTAEADQACVTRSSFFVDYRPAALAAAGELLRAIKAGAVDEEHIAAEIGTVAAGEHPGRRSDDEITLYKSLGVTAQDLAAAELVYRRCLELDSGLDVELLDLSQGSSSSG